MITKNLTIKYFKSQTRIQAIVLCKNNFQRELFFEISGVPKKYIKPGMESLIPALLPSAMSLGENLEIVGTVPQKILIGQKKFQSIISKWQRSLNKVLVAPSGVKNYRSNGKKVGLFFSGGVDSFYTFLKNSKESKSKITDFILVWGFDIAPKDKEFFDQVKNRIQHIAKLSDINLIIVKTNLKEITSGLVDWQWQVGGSLAAIALLLKNYFQIVHIASATGKKDTAPFGSHPRLDPLWSIDNMKIMHEENGCSRLERVCRYIAKSDLALNNLRVCWKQVKGQYNCSICEKCTRTMMELEVAGVLPYASTFNSYINYDKLRKTILHSSSYAFSEEVLQKLRQKNKNPELQRAIEDQLFISKNPPLSYKMKNFVHNLDHKFNNDRLFWNLSARGIL